MDASSDGPVPPTPPAAPRSPGSRVAVVAAGAAAALLAVSSAVGATVAVRAVTPPTASMVTPPGPLPTVSTVSRPGGLPAVDDHGPTSTTPPVTTSRPSPTTVTTRTPPTAPPTTSAPVNPASGRLPGVWRGTGRDILGNPATVETVLTPTGTFTQTYYSSGDPIYIAGSYASIGPGTLRFTITDHTDQWCGPLGCRVIQMQTGETVYYEFVDGDTLVTWGYQDTTRVQHHRVG